MTPPLCKKCKVPMVEREALEDVATGEPDFPGSEVVTMSYGKDAKLIPCWKCPECGWSVKR